MSTKHSDAVKEALRGRQCYTVVWTMSLTGGADFDKFLNAKGSQAEQKPIDDIAEWCQRATRSVTDEEKVGLATIHCNLIENSMTGDHEGKQLTLHFWIESERFFKDKAAVQETLDRLIRHAHHPLGGLFHSLEGYLAIKMTDFDPPLIATTDLGHRVPWEPSSVGIMRGRGSMGMRADGMEDT